MRSGVIRRRGRGAGGHISTERGDAWRSWRWVRFVVSARPSSAAVRVRRGEGLDTSWASGRKGGVCALRSCGRGPWQTVMGGRAGTLPSPSTAAPRGGGGEGPGPAATGKMAAAQAQRCFKMVAGARLGREGEVGVGGACAVTSRTGRSPGYGKSGTVTKARRVFPLPGKNADLREDPDGQDHHP